MAKLRVTKFTWLIGIKRNWAVLNKDTGKVYCLHSQWKSAFRCAELRVKRDGFYLGGRRK